MKMALAFLYSEQSRAKLTIAFLKMEEESSFLGLEMMMVAKNPDVVGFSFYLHAQRKENSSFIVETSRLWKSNIKHNQTRHSDAFVSASLRQSHRCASSWASREPCY